MLVPGSCTCQLAPAGSRLLCHYSRKLNICRHARGTSHPIPRSGSPLPYRRWVAGSRREKGSVSLSGELGRKNCNVCKGMCGDSGLQRQRAAPGMDGRCSQQKGPCPTHPQTYLFAFIQIRSKVQMGLGCLNTGSHKLRTSNSQGALASSLAKILIELDNRRGVL